MGALTEPMLAYAAYHRDPRNKLTHVFGVPIVMFSLFVPLSWFRFVHADIPLTAATLVYAATFIFYLKLDWILALLQLPVSVALLCLADRAALLPFWESVRVFLAAFIGGWTLQLIGHAIEGRRPALLDNITQVFNAPLFLTLELLFLLGRRKALHDLLNARLAGPMP